MTAGRPSPDGAAALPPPDIDLRALTPADAAALLPLIAAYGKALSYSHADETEVADKAGDGGGDHQGPDLAYVTRLLAEPHVFIRGAFAGDAGRERLVGFALFYDLPEAISRRRAGQIDDLYVLPETRGLGIARALIADIAVEGRTRGWVQLRWMVPHDNLGAQRLYDRIAEAAPWKNYVIWLEPGISW